MGRELKLQAKAFYPPAHLTKSHPQGSGLGDMV